MPRRRRPPRPGALSELAPLRIFTQIAVLQALYYATAVVLIVFTALAAGKQLSVGLVLGWETLRGDITEGWMFALVWMLNSLVTVIFLLLLIARSKLIPDFALTIHLLHLLATSLYSGSLPRNMFWWSVQIASAALMTSLGIWSCQWRELQPINFGGRGIANSPATRTMNGNLQEVEASASSNNEDGVGLSRGKGKALGRDGGGTYEMVSKG